MDFVAMFGVLFCEFALVHYRIFSLPFPILQHFPHDGSGEFFFYSCTFIIGVLAFNYLILCFFAFKLLLFSYLIFCLLFLFLIFNF